MLLVRFFLYELKFASSQGIVMNLIKTPGILPLPKCETFISLARPVTSSGVGGAVRHFGCRGVV